MSEVKRYTAWAAEVALPRGTMVVLAADYDALLARAKTAEADFLAAAECNVEQRKTIQRLQTELATEHLLADAAVDDANDAERRVAEMEELLRKSIEVGRRAIGDHFAPNDCYATGPLTGNPIADLIECPACSALSEYDRIDAALAGQQQQGEQCDLPPEGWFCTRSKGHEGPCAAVLHDWGVASYSLDLNWGNGRSAHDGQMTMEQYGALCRVLSPGWKGEHTDICGPGHDVGRAVAVPEVSGIGRDSGHPRSLILYLRKEPSDEDIRVIQEALRSAAPSAQQRESGDE